MRIKLTLLALGLSALVVFLVHYSRTHPIPVPLPVEGPLLTGAPLESETTLLLEAPIGASLFETPAEALPVWRTFQALRPTLVLFANDPLLLPLPEEFLEEAIRLVQKGSPDQLARAVDIQSSAPIVLPAMTVDAALRAGLFSRVVWVLPVDTDPSGLSLEVFRKQLLEREAVSPEEAESFILAEGGFHGSVRGIPLQAAPIANTPPIGGPVLLHIDLGYFQPLYKGEIKTNLYGLVQQTLLPLAEHQLQALAVTLSRSNLGGGLPLETRFLAGDLARIFAEPHLVRDQMPIAWQRRGSILYLENFFQKDKILELYLEMETEAPQDPSVQFGLYQVARQFKKGDEALARLARAVAVDPIYALEYLALADVAEEKGVPGKELEMLEKASAALPRNVFLRLALAEAYVEEGEKKKASPLLKELAREPWSAVYYPGMAGYLEELRKRP